MTEEKKRINAYLDVDLYAKLVNSGYGITEAVTKGLELLLEPPRTEITTEPIETIRPDAIEAKESIIKGLEARTNSLEEQLRVKDSQMNDRVKSLEGQLQTKDNQIEKLTENMQAQSVHIQTLINQKAIEAPGAKKPFWKFW
jgi:small-conductance mechanosensitive channel